ncbi:histidine kinase A domain protein [Rhodothermus marinus SG0.5JP17-172]|uniref:histidine kinase dimerization/phospho-acceptor domain-containing protein n=1 Tax=Rhodothermus marinus TaxID=29549 RepID=UPI000223DBF4|nr:histidine kinase dimerization/phospho-acceptor domain-containing protein [Rhodothermus marinus]AEN73661.1 histidine kinase A domain protein [Rhodothermus marinus SG0.5JP17-172]
METEKSSGVILLVVEEPAPESIVEALAAAGWEVRTCRPEELAGCLEQEAVHGVVVRVGAEAEPACLQTLRMVQAEAPRPVLLLTEAEPMRLAVALAQTGWLTAAAPDQPEAVQRWAQRLVASTVTPAAERLRQARRELSRLNHDLKNPLAIISGNAQFLHELIRLRGGDAELEGPVADIEEACRQLHVLLQRLIALRDTLPG